VVKGGEPNLCGSSYLLVLGKLLQDEVFLDYSERLGADDIS
jgi:hypothetical protein